MRTNSDSNSLISCGCAFALLVFNVFVGSWSVNYLLEFFLSKTIPFIGSALIGLFVGEISVPVAVVIAILKYFHVL